MGLLVAACSGASDDIIVDPVEFYGGHISLPSDAPDLSYAPVIMQVYEETDFQENGTLKADALADAARFYGGKLTADEALAFSFARLGYQIQGRYYVWVDVDGSSLGPGPLPNLQEARPGPGDYVAAFQPTEPSEAREFLATRIDGEAETQGLRFLFHLRTRPGFFPLNLTTLAFIGLRTTGVTDSELFRSELPMETTSIGVRVVSALVQENIAPEPLRIRLEVGNFVHTLDPLFIDTVGTSGRAAVIELEF
jgi:hypothetical protein